MDEYIDLKQALDLIESSGMWGWSKEQLYDQMQDIPAADVAPVRHGRWIQSKIVPAYHYCSLCKVTHKMKMSCNVYVFMKYCPNCGAKMLEG